MDDISQITDFLYVASKITDRHDSAIRERGIRLVISMIGKGRRSVKKEGGFYDVLFLKSYDTFLTPIPMRVLVRGVESALAVIKKKQKVLVYCKQGKRRSVTLAAAILIAQGGTSSDTIKLLLEKRSVAAPMLWYVRWRIRKFEKFWVKRKQKREGEV